MLEEGINRDDKIEQMIKLMQPRHLSITWTPKKKLNWMSQTQNHQGVIAEAVVKAKSIQDYLEKVSFADSELMSMGKSSQIPAHKLIYIREAQLEDNAGAIARSAEVFGLDGIVLQPKHAISPQLFRTSAGALAHVEIIQESLYSAISALKRANWNIVGIEVNTDTYYYDAPLTGDTLFIIGGEDKSLSTELTDKCDTIVKIPMHGKINSLNMSVAAAIVMAESARQESVVNAKRK